MKKLWAEFKKFISRGNVIDMAIGVIVGSAFSAIVTSLTNKIIMPLINALLSLGGGGLEDAYTYLIKVKDATTGKVDLEKSIYIDWGAFITAIINFILIAMVLFAILKIVAKSREIINGVVRSTPNRAQRKALKARGVNMRNRAEVKVAFEQMLQEEADKKKAEELANKKPTDLELLTEIRDLLKQQAVQKEVVEQDKPVEAESTKKTKKA